MLSNDLSKSVDEDQIVELTAESVLYLWSKTYNTNGKPDWSHIYPYYHKELTRPPTLFSFSQTITL